MKLAEQKLECSHKANAKANAKRNKDLASNFNTARVEVEQVIHKVKAHAQDRLLHGLIDPIHYLGNLCADAGAGALTERSLNTLAWQEAEWHGAWTFMIATRLAILESEATELIPTHIRVRVANPTPVTRLSAK